MSSSINQYCLDNKLNNNYSEIHKISQMSTLANSPNTLSLINSAYSLAEIDESKEMESTNKLNLILESSIPSLNALNENSIITKSNEKNSPLEYEKSSIAKEVYISSITNSNTKDTNNLEIEKKTFNTKEEKIKFVQGYQKKIKTEICKNWELKGFCKYSNKCSFAHGKDELKFNTGTKNNYKLKPCRNFFIKGFCMYGYRCQYIHSDIKKRPEFFSFLENIYKSKNLIFKTNYAKLFLSREYIFESIILNLHTNVYNGETLDKSFQQAFANFK